MLTDSVSGYTDCADKSVQHATPTSNQTICVLEDGHRLSFQSGKATLNDYNFEQPSTDLTATTTTVLTNSAFKSWGFMIIRRLLVKSDGTAFSRTRMEGPESAYEVVEGEASYVSFVPARRSRCRSTK